MSERGRKRAIEIDRKIDLFLNAANPYLVYIQVTFFIILTEKIVYVFPHLL